MATEIISGINITANAKVEYNEYKIIIKFGLIRCTFAKQHWYSEVIQQMKNQSNCIQFHTRVRIAFHAVVSDLCSTVCCSETDVNDILIQHKFECNVCSYMQKDTVYFLNRSTSLIRTATTITGKENWNEKNE